MNREIIGSPFVIMNAFFAAFLVLFFSVPAVKAADGVRILTDGFVEVPEKYLPAIFDVTAKKITLGSREFVLPESLHRLFPADRPRDGIFGKGGGEVITAIPHEIVFTYNEGTEVAGIPPYLLLKIKPTGKDHEVIIRVEVEPTMKVTDAMVRLPGFDLLHLDIGEAK